MTNRVKPSHISPREFDRFDKIKTLYLGKSGYKRISKEVLKTNFDWLSKFYNANIDSIINIDTIIPKYSSCQKSLVIKSACKSLANIIANVDDILNKFYRVDKLEENMKAQRITVTRYEEMLRKNKKRLVK